MEYANNTTYIFIPFSFKKPSDFKLIIDSVDKCSSWTQVRDEILYMLKYVADKLNSKDGENCRCYHYELDNKAREAIGIASAECWYALSERSFHNKPDPYRFQIKSVQLYCFSTTVCMMAYQIQFEHNDPYWISSAQYYVKKVSREKIYPQNIGNAPETMLDISKRAVADFEPASGFSFFYYANPSTERANVLTYLEVEPKEDYRNELFYLRRCYNEGFIYFENEALDKKEIYMPSRDTVWGISPEAAVCLTCPERGSADFIRGTFYKNFNAQYLFMYVLLLHQKYVLYMFLTKIGIGIFNDIDMLEEYRNQLYEFETDFVFSCVTEVPQYQNLYEKMTQAFSLKKMYEDVQEPLISLGEVRRATSEKAAKKRDNSVNKALFMLSILSFFSALADSFDFADSFFSWFLGDVGVIIVQIICIVGIVAVVVVVLKSLYDSWRSSK